VSILFISACSNTHKETLSGGIKGSFVSSYSPVKLARCIDGNARLHLSGSLDPLIVDIDTKPIEVDIINGSYYWAIIFISENESGSQADFYLGGAGKLFPKSSISDVTRDCS